MVRGEERSGFDFPVPPVARARLKLELPPEAKASSVRRPPAVRRGKPRPITNWWTWARPGGSPVQWPSPLVAEPGSPGVEADQLLWLKIRPGAVVLDAKFTFAASPPALRRVQLRAGPTARLAAAPADQPIAAWSEQNGTPRTLLFDLKPSIVPGR